MDTKLKCLLLDDELHSLSYLKLLCEQIAEIEVIKAFNNPLDFLDQHQKLDYDLLILDIEMPGINGIQLIDFIHNKGVIFTTAYSEYAADAFDLQAIDYIRKPLRLDRLKQAIGKAQDYMRRSPKEAKSFTQLNSDRGKFLLHFDQIRYIKTAADSRDKIVILKDTSEVTLKNISFESLIQLLPTKQFSRVNKRELLALNIVTAFSYDEITSNIVQANGLLKLFTLGESYKAEFIQKLTL